MPVEAKWRDIVDGFMLSASQLYLPINYRAHALAQMEILRRAAAYRCREYTVPNKLQTVIPAFSQVEQQVAVNPGSYVWAISFASLPVGPVDESSFIFIQITDACTEVPFFSDYIRATQYKPTPAATGNSVTRNPPLLSPPRLIGEPGHLDVEIYNTFSSDVTCQVNISVAEPAIPPQQMERYFELRRIREMVEGEAAY